MKSADGVLSWVAVGVGGLVGTGLRLGIDLLLPHAVDEIPWSTLLVNAVGSYALGFLVAAVWPRVPRWIGSGIGVGLLGSFTTFSAYAVAAVGIARGDFTSSHLATGDLGLSLLLVAGGFLSAVFFAWLGLASGRVQIRYRPHTADEVLRELTEQEEREEE